MSTSVVRIVRHSWFVAFALVLSTESHGGSRPVDHAVRRTGQLLLKSTPQVAGEAYKRRTGFQCFLPAAVDPDFAFAPTTVDATQLACAHATVEQFDAVLAGANWSLLSNRTDEGPCPLSATLREPNGEPWTALAERIGREPHFDDVRRKVGEVLGARIRRLTRREALNLGFCLHAARPFARNDLGPENRATFWFERALEDEIRQTLLTQHQLQVDFEQVFRTPDRFENLLDAQNGVCPSAQRKASFLEAYIFSEPTRLAGQAQRIATWRRRHSSAETHPDTEPKSDERYRQAVRAELCKQRGNASDLEAFSKARKALVGSGEQLPPWMDFALTIDVRVVRAGQGRAAAYLAEGIPMPPAEAAAWTTTLNSCPGLLDSLRTKFRAQLQDTLGAAPFPAEWFTANAGAPPVERPDFETLLNTSIERTRLIVGLVDRGQLCRDTVAAGSEGSDARGALSELFGSRPTSLNDVRRRFENAVESLQRADAQGPRHLAVEAAGRLFDADLLDIRRLARQLDESDPAHTTFIPTALAFRQERDEAPACFVPFADDARFFLADPSYVADHLRGPLTQIDVLLTDARRNLGATPFELSYLWFVKGSRGPAPRAALPADGAFRQHFPIRAGVSSGDVTPLLPSLFANGPAYRQWLARFLPRVPTGPNGAPAPWDPRDVAHTSAALAAARGSAYPVLALMAMREAMLDAAENLVADVASTPRGAHSMPTYRERAASERRALQMLRRDLCADHRQGGHALHELALLTAATRPMLEALAAQSPRFAAPLPFTEKLLRLYLSLAPAHRIEMSEAIFSNQCFARVPEARRTLERVLFELAPGTEAPVEKKQGWLENLRRLGFACEIADRLGPANYGTLLASALDSNTLHDLATRVRALAADVRDVRVVLSETGFQLVFDRVTAAPGHTLPTVERGLASTETRAPAARQAVAAFADVQRLNGQLPSWEREAIARRFRNDWVAAYGEAEAFPDLMTPEGSARLRAFVYLRALALAPTGATTAATELPPGVASNPRIARAFRRGQELSLAAGRLRAWHAMTPAQRAQDPILGPMAHLDDGELLHQIAVERRRWATELRTLRTQSPELAALVTAGFDALPSLEHDLASRVLGRRVAATTGRMDDRYTSLVLEYGLPIGGNLKVTVPIETLRRSPRVSDAIFQSVRGSCQRVEYERAERNFNGLSLGPVAWITGTTDRPQGYPYEAQRRARDLLCWAALTTAPIAAETWRDVAREARFQTFLDAVRAWLDRPVAYPAESTVPGNAHLRHVMHLLVHKPEEARTELVRLRDSGQESDHAIFRDAVAMSLSLGSGTPQFQRAFEVAIPPHVLESRGLRGRTFNERLRIAPPEWLDRQWAMARSHAQGNTQPGIGDLDELEASLDEAVLEAEHRASPQPLLPARPQGPPVPPSRLAESSRKVLRWWLESVTRDCRHQGRLDLGCVRARRLPIDELQGLLSDTPSLGGIALPLTFSRDFVVAQRAALRGFLSASPPATEITLHPAFRLLLPDLVGEGDVAVTRPVPTTPDRRPAIVEAEAILGQLEALLTTQLEKENPETRPQTSEIAAFRRFLDRDGTRDLALNADGRRLLADPASLRARLDHGFRGPEFLSAVTAADYHITPGRIPGPYAGFNVSGGRVARATRGAIPATIPDHLSVGPNPAARGEMHFRLEAERRALSELARLRQESGELFLCSQHGAPIDSRRVGGQVIPRYEAPLAPVQNLGNARPGASEDFPSKQSIPAPSLTAPGIEGEKRWCAERYQAQLEVIAQHEAAMNGGGASSARFRPTPSALDEIRGALPPFLRLSVDLYTEAASHNETRDDDRQQFDRLRQAPWTAPLLEFVRHARYPGQNARNAGYLCRSVATTMASEMRRSEGFDSALAPVETFGGAEIPELCGTVSHERVEAIRAKALSLLLGLYANHPLVGQARQIPPSEWTREPPSELVLVLRQRLEQELLNERNDLATRSPLGARDWAKQILLMAVLMAEQHGFTATGDDAEQLEVASGGMQRLSPLHAAFFAAMEREAPIAPQSRFVRHGDGTVTLGSLSRPGLDGTLGTHFSAQQRIALAVWDPSDWTAYAAMERRVAETAHGASASTAGAEMLYRRVRLSAMTGAGILVRANDPSGEFVALEQARAAASANNVANGVLNSLTEMRALTAEESAWVDQQVSVIADDPSNAGRNRVAIREAFLDELRRRAAVRLLADLYRRHLGRGDETTARERRFAFDDYVLALRTLPYGTTRGSNEGLQGMPFGPDAHPSIIGPNGVFPEDHGAANEHFLRMRALLDTRARNAANARPIEPAEIETEVSVIRDRMAEELAHEVVAAHTRPGTYAGEGDARIVVPSAVELIRQCDARRYAVAAGRRPVAPAEAQAAVVASRATMEQFRQALHQNNVRRVAIEERMRISQRLVASLRRQVTHLRMSRNSIARRIEQAQGLVQGHPYFMDIRQRTAAGAKLARFDQTIVERSRQLEAAQRTFNDTQLEYDRVLASAPALPAPAVLAAESKASADDHEACLREGFQTRWAALSQFHPTNNSLAAQLAAGRAYGAAKNWYERAKMVAVLHVRRKPGRPEFPAGLPPEAATIFSRDAIDSVFAGDENAARAEWDRLLNQALGYEQSLREAAAPLAAYGLNLQALLNRPPDFSGLRVPDGAAKSFSTKDLRALFRNLTRHMAGEPFLQALPDAPPPARPEYDALLTALELRMNQHWSESGRQERFEQGATRAIGPEVDAERGTYAFRVYRLSDEQARGREALAAASAVVRNVNRFADLRASRDHMVDMFGHAAAADRATREDLEKLTTGIATLEGLDGLDLTEKDGEAPLSGLAHATRLAIDRDLEVRSDLGETFRLIDEDSAWRYKSYGLWAATIAGSVLTAGAASPSMVFLQAGFHGAATINTLTHVGAFVNDVGYGIQMADGSRPLYDANHHWADVGRSNAIGSLAFFLGSGTGAYLGHYVKTVAAVRAGAASHGGQSVAELGEMAARARLRLPALRAQAGSQTQLALTAEERILLGVTEGSQTVGGLERAIAMVEFANSRAASLASGYGRVQVLGNVGITYAAAIGVHGGFEYHDEAVAGRNPNAWTIAQRQAASHATTAMFAGGGDRFIADRFRRLSTKVAAAGAVNVSISAFGEHVADGLQDEEARRTIERLMTMPAGDGRRDQELEAMVKSLAEREKERHDRFWREWLHRGIFDVGRFALSAGRASFQTQAHERFMAAVTRGVPLAEARARMVREIRGGLLADLWEHPLATVYRRVQSRGEPREELLSQMPGGDQALLHAVRAAQLPAASEATRAFVAEEMGHLRQALHLAGFDLEPAQVRARLERYVALPEEVRRAPMLSVERALDGTPYPNATFTNFQVWLETSLLRERADRARADRLSGPAGTIGARDALDRERTAWQAIVRRNSLEALALPIDLLIDAPSAFRDVTAQAIAYANGTPAEADRLRSFLVRRVANENSGYRTLGDATNDFFRASPNNVASAVHWMTERRVGVAEYLAIFGPGGDAPRVVAERLATIEEAARRTRPDVVALEAHVRRGLTAPDAAAQSEADWMSSFRGGAPVNP